jgi:hypothetical protein
MPHHTEVYLKLVEIKTKLNFLHKASVDSTHQHFNLIFNNRPHLLIDPDESEGSATNSIYKTVYLTLVPL